MIERERQIRLDKANRAAKTLRLRNTELMIEGLAEELRDFEYRSVKDTPKRAKRIMNKVDLLRNSMENEWSAMDEKEASSEARALIYYRIGESVLINFAAGGFFFMLPEFAQVQSVLMTALLKVGAFSFFGLRMLKEIRDIMLEAGDYTVEGMRRNIEDLCHFTKDYIYKAFLDPEVEEIPPI